MDSEGSQYKFGSKGANVSVLWQFTTLAGLEQLVESLKAENERLRKLLPHEAWSVGAN